MDLTNRDHLKNDGELGTLKVIKKVVNKSFFRHIALPAEFVARCEA
jgi:hypothetical protein